MNDSSTDYTEMPPRRSRQPLEGLFFRLCNLFVKEFQRLPAARRLSSLREEEKRHSKNLYEKNSYSLVFQHIFLQNDSLRTASVFSTTAAAAGAVYAIHGQHLDFLIEFFGYCRPGGEAFCLSVL